MNFTDTFNLSLLGDVIQIAILYGAFYWILRIAKGSRFGQVLTGAAILMAALNAFTFLFHFDVLSHLLHIMVFYLAISPVVIFQPEIRRILATLGSLLSPDRSRTALDRNRVTPELLADAFFVLAQRRIGALFAFERGISLRGYQTTGVTLDALPSAELFVSLFTEPMPLHDGGAIIRNGRLACAHCLFPVSSSPSLSESGMRHRAAVGLSEETDAIIIAVSEERGRLSVAINGHLIRYPDLSSTTRTALVRWIRKAMPYRKTLLENFFDWLWHRINLYRIRKTETVTKAQPMPSQPALTETPA